ncbi:MAG TPA: hypothetical protein VJT49_23240 [Amycolatopsis sp.]|uniref:hypothetical protein n=1 Tax=Amycolatopsis sp. TaxID=37632 RepID=UPI002B486E03|nr:hypothetical protein [Amycolatopsis sp.]HKS47972.1 hypothetical protein [Amycolatopsis sp.]
MRGYEFLRKARRLRRSKIAIRVTPARHTLERSCSVWTAADKVAAMAPHTTPAVDPTPVGDISVEDLITRAADLKGELVAFAQSPRFARRLDALLIDAADRHGYLDESTAIRTIDHFALQYRLSDGRTVVERFVAQRRPQLSDDEQAMMLGWRDVVEGCFEVRQFDGDAVELHNLLDDLTYRVYSNMGRKPFTKLRKGMFVIGRIVPVHPATDAWLVSGHFVTFPKSARHQIAQTAVREITARPELLRRNPALLRRAGEVQAEHRADFVAQVGSDLVVLPPEEAQETLREHYRRLRQKAVADLDGKAAKHAATRRPTPEEMGRLPDELLEADDIALIYDESEGLNYYRDFGHLDALFADPALARARTNLAQLREYLHDDSVSPLAIRRLVQRHPDGADPVFRALLRKPGFSWSRDGERLLRRHKKAFFDREPMPSVSIIGERLAALLRTG